MRVYRSPEVGRCVPQIGACVYRPAIYHVRAEQEGEIPHDVEHDPVRAVVPQVAPLQRKPAFALEALGLEPFSSRLIEDLSPGGNHPLQVAWRELNVAQCGYCQPGQIMQAAALLQDKPNPSDADIDEAMNGNLCRCGTYPRIRAAIKQAAKGGRP